MSRLLPFFSFIVGTSAGWPAKVRPSSARHFAGRCKLELSRVADEGRDGRRLRAEGVPYATGWKQL